MRETENMKIAARGIAGARALVTGGAGFVGSHLCEALLANGCEVIAFDNLSTGTRANVAHLDPRGGFELVVGDIADEELVASLAARSDVIFHLAAAVGVEMIVDSPLRSLHANVAGTEVVLRVAARYGVPTLLASTSEVYGKVESFPQNEEDNVIIGPSSVRRWSYAAGKLLDEFLALAYHQECGLPVTIFRLFNTVGPRQTGHYGMVIPRFADAALSGGTLEVNGDGLQSRCFLHVHDAVDGIMALASTPSAVGKVFNIGSSEEVSIMELAERVLAAAREHLEPVAPELAARGQIRNRSYAEAFPNGGYEDIRRRVPDTSRVREHTGWRQQRTLDDVIEAVVAERLGDALAAAERLALV
jgi:UDP-glucose 4-epimerase